MSDAQSFNVRSPNVEFAIIGVFGGDNNLTQHVADHLVEAARVPDGSFSLLALVDYFDRGAEIVEMVPGARRRLLSARQPMETLSPASHPHAGHSHTAHSHTSDPHEGLGEINVGDPGIIKDFLTRALKSYSPTTRKAIGFASHGTGVLESAAFAPNTTLFRDENPVAARYASELLAVSPPFHHIRDLPVSGVTDDNPGHVHDPEMAGGDELTNAEIRTALQGAFAESETQQVDLIFFDSCINGMIEVMDQVKEFARVVIGSEDIEPEGGWAYDLWLNRIQTGVPQTADEWARQAVRAFDEKWRDETAAHPCTLGAFRTDHKITKRFRDLTDACRSKEGFDLLMQARAVTQSFAKQNLYDIRHFAENLETLTLSRRNILEASRALLHAFDEAYIDSVALPPGFTGSYGLAFWFPEYRASYDSVKNSYRNLEFNKETRWLEYLEEYAFNVLKSRVK